MMSGRANERFEINGNSVSHFQWKSTRNALRRFLTLGIIFYFAVIKSLSRAEPIEMRVGGLEFECLLEGSFHSLFS